MDLNMIALAGFAAAALVMLLVTQTKARVSWPGWVAPVAFAVPAGVWTGLAIAEQGLLGCWPMVTGSPWGLQMLFDRLLCLSAALFLLATGSVASKNARLARKIMHG